MSLPKRKIYDIKTLISLNQHEESVVSEVTLMDGNMSSILGAFHQIAFLTSYIAETFDSLLQLSEDVHERVNNLSNRTTTLFQKLPILESRLISVELSASDFGHSSSIAKDMFLNDRDSYIPNVLSRSTNCNQIMSQYHACQPLPPFWKLKSITEQDTTNYYSNPGFFFQDWLKTEQVNQLTLRHHMKKLKAIKKLKKIQQFKTNVDNKMPGKKLLADINLSNDVASNNYTANLSESIKNEENSKESHNIPNLPQSQSTVKVPRPPPPMKMPTPPPSSKIPAPPGPPPPVKRTSVIPPPSSKLPTPPPPPSSSSSKAPPPPVKRTSVIPPPPPVILKPPTNQEPLVQKKQSIIETNNNNDLGMTRRPTNRGSQHAVRASIRSSTYNASSDISKEGSNSNTDQKKSLNKLFASVDNGYDPSSGNNEFNLPTRAKFSGLDDNSYDSHSKNLFDDINVTNDNNDNSRKVHNVTDTPVSVQDRFRRLSLIRTSKPSKPGSRTDIDITTILEMAGSIDKRVPGNSKAGNSKPAAFNFDPLLPKDFSFDKSYSRIKSSRMTKKSSVRLTSSLSAVNKHIDNKNYIDDDLDDEDDDDLPPPPSDDDDDEPSMITKKPVMKSALNSNVLDSLKLGNVPLKKAPKTAPKVDVRNEMLKNIVSGVALKAAQVVPRDKKPIDQNDAVRAILSKRQHIAGDSDSDGLSSNEFSDDEYGR